MGYHFIRLLPCSALHACILSSLVFMIPLRKRPHFHLRLILGLILAFIVVAKLPPLRIVLFRALYLDKIHYAPLSYLAYTLTDVLPVLLLSCGLIYLCCDIRFHKAFYASSLAYLTQSIAFTAFNILFPDFRHRPYDASMFPILWREFLVAAVVYAAVYFILARKLPRDGTYRFNCVYPLPVLLIIILSDRYFSIVSTHFFNAEGTPLFGYMLIHEVVLSILLLSTQTKHSNIAKYRTDLEVQTQVQALQQKEYKLFKKNMDALNHKLHDLRRLTRALQLSADDEANQALLQELQEHINTHDCFMDTGNDTLNALLSGVWLRCEHQKIHWTCMADGTAVAFLPPTDLFVMLDNALDNAVEAAAQATAPEDRFLAVTISKNQQFAYIRIENYCLEAPEFADGLPQTTKPDKEQHGFGTRSIRDICVKHGGQCRMRAEDHLFITELLLPIPTE